MFVRRQGGGMHGTLRTAAVVGGIAVLATAALLLMGHPLARAFWPYSTYGAMSRVFLGSMLAAVGAPMIWIGLSGELAGLRSGAANIMTVSLGLGIHAAIRSGGTPGPILWFAVANAVTLLGAAGLYWAVRELPWRDTRPTPLLVRGFFGLFAAVLLLAGGALILGQQIFPWTLDRDSATAYGVMFLGAMTYFVYGLIRPLWGNAKGQLLGFLAYDLVLIAPYLQLWPGTTGVSRLSLSIYIAVLAVSGGLAIGYLLLSPSWRLRMSGPSAPAVASA